MTRIWMVRHGESLLNAAHRLQGWSDAPLTARGVEQASARAGDFARLGVRFDAVVSADGIRHRQTARVLAPEAERAEDEDWREICFGALEGAKVRKVSGMLARFRDTADPMREVLLALAARDIGAEHPDVVVARASAALERAAGLGDEVLVVTSGITKMLLLGALGGDLSRVTGGPSNLSVSTLDGAPGAWTVTRAVVDEL
ncbi:histidine phosphatase family protein [Streptomyces sp. AC495_CC817]|uniref:histidine phosphatase family protein n=1 Tax=Streptomyces sp. AC495_CC817 TaxID=2823900 RepID=UPI001C273F4A|nr:histidine phosphatase family protein [Streptomyces sp. AC495_CC817]